MSHFNLIIAAVDYIEEQLTDEHLTVASVAQRVGISKWYFQRVFKALTGDTLGNYIRKRRLTLAAADLIETTLPIAQVAFDYGFESHEAFTRSFRSQFETSPGQYRRDRVARPILHKFEITKDYLRHLVEDVTLKPTFEERDEIKLVGFRAPFRGVFNDNPNNHEVISQLWRSLMTRLDEIPFSITGSTYGFVECKTEQGEEKMEYLAAIAVERFGDIPEGMTSLVIPEGQIVKFEHQGSPATIDKTIKYVFGTWLPQSQHAVRDGLELEIYPADYDPSSPDSVFEYCLLLQ